MNSLIAACDFKGFSRNFDRPDSSFLKKLFDKFNEFFSFFSLEFVKALNRNFYKIEPRNTQES